MDLKNRYAFVAMFDGKKVKKYFKTLEELVGIEWITETKFWTRNEDSAYCEGIVLAKDENERTLRDRVSKKSLRIPYNAFKPFPDPNVQPMNLVEKWKKKLAKMAMNDYSIFKKYREQLTGEKFTESQMPKKSSVETIKDKEVNGSTILRNLKEHKVDHHAIAKEAVPFVENGSKILTFTNPEKKILKHTFVIQLNQSTTMEKEATNEDTIYRKKYKKLRRKYRLLKTIFIGQQNQYARDLQIQYFAQSLYKAIKKRYDYDEDDE